MSKRILLTGATGFLGRHTRPVLELKYGKENVVSVSSSDYDLMRPDQAEKMFNEHLYLLPIMELFHPQQTKYR